MTDRVEIERAVAAELYRRGHYDDTPDAQEWMTREAADAVRAALEAEADKSTAVRAVLMNSGLHDVTDPDQASCLEEDVEAVVLTVERLAGTRGGGPACP